MEKDNSLKNRIKELEESYKRLNSKNDKPKILPKKREFPIETQNHFSQPQNHSENIKPTIKPEFNEKEIQKNPLPIEETPQWIQPSPKNNTYVENTLILPKNKNDEIVDSEDKTVTAAVEIDTCYLPTQNSQVASAIFSTQDQIHKFESKLKAEKERFFDNMPHEDIDPKMLSEYIKKHNKLIKKIEKKINSLYKRKNDSDLIEKTIELQNEFLEDKTLLDRKVEQHIRSVENDYLKRQKLMKKWEGLKVSEKVAKFMQTRYNDVQNPLSKNNKNE